MVFLNPSILLGLFAATIPILIHILNFRKLKKVEFSTLTFLKELQKSKIKKIKIKQWLLLLLRTLIIIFLVLAFARPTFESTYFGGATSTAKSSVAFVIDNSFSMSLIKNNGSIFNKSKAEAKRIVNQMQNGDEFYFIISSDSVLHFTDKRTAIKFISEFDISLLMESLNKKIEKAISALDKTQNINKELYLFTDFQKNTFFDSTDQKIAEAKRIKLYSFDVGENNASNISVTNLKLENSIIEVKKPIEFSAVINNFSQNTVNNINASLFINGEHIARQNISLSGNEHKKIKFNATLKTNGIIEAEVHLDEDNINQDNTNYLSFFVPGKIKILLLYDDISDTKYLNAVFGSSLLTDKFEVTKINTKVNDIKYSSFDVLFLLSTNIAVIKEVQKSVAIGGKLVIIPPTKTNINDLQPLSSKLKYPIAKKIIQTNKKGNDYAEFDKINFEHPIFQNLFDIKNKNKIESPFIFKHIELKNNYNVSPIIKLNNGNIFLGEYNFGKGKILFFNTAISLNWSNFPIKGIFAPLLTKVVYYLSSNNTVFNNYTVGNKIAIDISNITYPKLDIQLPSGKDNVSLENFNGKIYNYTETLQVGNYKFYSNNKLVKLASVNVNPKESNLTKVTEETKNSIFKKYFGNNFMNLDITENYIGKIKQARYGTELWKPFLIIAFLLAIIEMFVARNTKKDIMNLDKR
jgi:hypothetical protein